jgi:hypothetical protein
VFERGLQSGQDGFDRIVLGGLKTRDRPRADPARPTQVGLIPPEKRSGGAALSGCDWHKRIISPCTNNARRQFSGYNPNLGDYALLDISIRMVWVG